MAQYRQTSITAWTKRLRTPGGYTPDDLRTSPAEMTDDELQREIRKAAIDLIQENPMIAVAAAQAIGWTVVPPEDVTA